MDRKCGHAVAHILAIEYRCLAQVVVFRPHAIKDYFFVISHNLYLDNGPMDTNAAFLFTAITSPVIGALRVIILLDTLIDVGSS